MIWLNNNQCSQMYTLFRTWRVYVFSSVKNGLDNREGFWNLNEINMNTHSNEFRTVTLTISRPLLIEAQYYL